MRSLSLYFATENKSHGNSKDQQYCESYIDTYGTTTRALKTTRGQLMPRSSMCIMDLLALWTRLITFFYTSPPVGKSMLAQE